MQEKINDEDLTIDFSALFRVLRKEQFVLGAIVLIAMVLGGIYAFTAKVEFMTEGKILPELSSKSKGGLGGLGGLAGLAGLAGVNLDNLSSTDAFRPDLYPNIINSSPFYLHLLKQQVVMKNGKSIVFQQYFNDYIYESSWLGNLFENKSIELAPFKVAVDDNVVYLNKKENFAKKDLAKRIVAIYDKKTGVISINVKMPDPIVAAKVASLTMNYITEYITHYRTEKARQDLDFLRKMVAEAKGKYYGEQVKKAQYSDHSKFIAVQSADLQRERIESDYKVSTSVYNNLLGQLEQAKIKLQEETPVLQVLDPPQIPLYKSEPKKSIIMLIATFLGIIVGFLVVIFRRKNYKLIFKT